MSTTRERLTEPVDTSTGSVIGYIDDGIRRFLGIPYAAPPIGDRRWRPPSTPIPWEQPLTATFFREAPAQEAPSLHGFGHVSFNEDCLYLNIFSPLHQRGLCPVMVLIPGGGFVCGSGNDYDPSWLVKEGNIVFVSLNYRLGVFGFFSHPAINKDGNQPMGNFGIMDQQLALTWVQRNVTAFGGDPANVTIIGQSAGGACVMAHMGSPSSKGLFHKAIIQSGGAPATLSNPTIESLEQAGVDFACAAGCPLLEQTAERLRQIPTKALLAANSLPAGSFGTGRFAFRLMEDGIIVPLSLREKFAAGHFHRVPVVTGITRDEFSWFQAMAELSTGRSITPENYVQVLTRMLRGSGQAAYLGIQLPEEEVGQVLQRYSPESYPTPSRALAATIGDAGIISTTGRRCARVLSHFTRVYAYEFDVPDSPIAWPEVSFAYGSAHAQELQYLYPLFCGGSGKARALSKDQRRLAHSIVQYWTTFAWQGVPSAPEVASWTVYNHEDDNIMLLETPEPRMTNQWGSRHNSDYWDSFYI